MVKKILANCYIYLILLLMYLPIFVLIAFSFTTSKQVGVWEGGFTFQLYADLFNDKQIMKALGNTLILAFSSAILATLIGSLGAIGAFYAKKKSRRLIETANEIPVVNAEIVTAVSLTVLFLFIARIFGINKENALSFWTLLIGHVVLAAPFVYLNVKPKLAQMDPSLYEAALDLGATPNRAINKVVIPQILPGIASGFLLAITLSLDDFIITAFTRGSGLLSGEGQIETLSTLIEAKIKKTSVPAPLRALTTIIFLIVLTIVIVQSILVNRKNKNHENARRKI